jgi:hypothetical protein
VNGGMIAGIVFVIGALILASRGLHGVPWQRQIKLAAVWLAILTGLYLVAEYAGMGLPE